MSMLLGITIGILLGLIIGVFFSPQNIGIGLLLGVAFGSLMAAVLEIIRAIKGIKKRGK